MAFNSLDAQREACEAYIKSQRSEGWVMLPDAYDDGGFSGGSMERPGLKRLMADVKAGKVDVIVVYKVDRLTRALSDFARIVDVLDSAGASFVSVTQAFNTTTSMGRLTLNVLLSFAQFEREVGAERIRDKIAQSKARGIWMGGALPLGYAVQDRKLIPVPEEAKTVERIFTLCLKEPSVRSLKARLDDEAIVTKVQNRKSGRVGGTPFTRGGLYYLLSNPVFIGKIRHKDKVYDGEHPAIIPLDLWQAVQDRLAAQAADRTRQANAPGTALLTGLLRDHANRPLSPTHSTKRQRRYYYYASGTAQDFTQGKTAQESEPVVRIAQRHADQAVRHAILGLFTADAVVETIQPLGLDLGAMQTVLCRASEISHQCSAKADGALRQLLITLDFRMVIQPGGTAASIDRSKLLAVILGNQATDQQKPLTCPLI